MRRPTFFPSTWGRSGDRPRRFFEWDDRIGSGFFPLAPGCVAVVPVVAHHLFPFIGDMAGHGGQPLQGLEHPCGLSVLGPIDHRSCFRNIGHPLLRERSPDDVPGQILHGHFLPGKDPRSAVDVEPGMAPSIQQRDHVLGDLAFFQKHRKHMVPEQAFQSPDIDCGRSNRSS